MEEWEINLCKASINDLIEKIVKMDPQRITTVNALISGYYKGMVKAEAEKGRQDGTSTTNK